MLTRLAEANRQGIEGEWEFNEWLHGRSGHPMGFPKQAWSAAMYVYAHRAVESGELPLFDQLLAAKPESARATEVNDIIVHAGGGPVE